MKAVPIELKDAQNYINTYHRHHQRIVTVIEDWVEEKENKMKNI